MERITIAALLEKMLGESEGNLKDFEHLVKVWAYARTIAQLEGVPEETAYVTEAAAITHDIACPMLRRTIGCTDHKQQEEKGAPMVRDFLEGTGMSPEEIDRISYLIGHHHTLTGIEGIDYQILIEADYLVNASEKGYSQETIRNFTDQIFRTDAGRSLAQKLFHL